MGDQQEQAAIGGVGFIGLGQIGSPMAEHWLEWAGGLTVFDLRAEATAPFGEKGAHVAASVGEVAERADLISVMVLNDDQVRSVVDGLLPSLRPGAVIAIHSTIRPETAVELAPVVAAAGGALIDAPVSGGFMGAGEGRLAIMVGGDRAAYDRVKEPFKAFAEVLVHCGDPGSGTECKVARNLITFVSYCATFEAQRLAEAAGIDLSKLGRVTRHSDSLSGGPGAIIVRQTTGPMPADDGLFDIFTHTQHLGEKDLELALELGERLGVDLPMTRYSSRTFAAGLGLAAWPDKETL